MFDPTSRPGFELVDLNAGAQGSSPLDVFQSESESRFSANDPRPHPFQSESESRFGADVRRAPVAGSSEAPIPIAGLIDQSGACEWHDVVAVVNQLVDQLVYSSEHEGPGSIPSVEQLWLKSDATLIVQGGGSGADSPTVSLGRLLQQLLAGKDQPVQLRLIALQAADSIGTMSMTDLTRELARWERPRRHEKLIELYGRLRALSSTDINALNAKASVMSPVFHPAALDAAEKSNRRRATRSLSVRKLAVLLAVSPLLFALAIVALYTPRGAAARSDKVLVLRQTVSFISNVPASTYRRLVNILAEAEPQAPPVLPSESETMRTASSQRVGMKREARAAVRSSTNVSPVASTLGDAPSSTPVERASALTSVAAITSSSQEEFNRAQLLFQEKQYTEALAAFTRVTRMLEGSGAGPSDLRWKANEYAELTRALISDHSSHVYTSGDPSVSEPIPLGSFLPPPVSGASGGVLDLVIDARGTVESVHLTGGRESFRSRWWVPAAKAWRFRPALKDGVPVRFLKRVALPGEPPALR